MDKTGRRLIAAGAALLAAFVAMTVVVATGLPLGPDIALARAVQAVPWGPVVPIFAAVDYVEGPKQVALAAVVVVAVFVLRRRLTVAAIACAVSAAAYEAVQLAVHRPRPPASLVHVLRHPDGFSYPSGHAVFYFWALAVLVIALAARWPRTVAASVPAAVLLYASVLAGRVYGGEHWPSDCLAGLLLGAGWTLTVLALVRKRDGHRLSLGEAVQHPLDRELAPDP